ncbi:hypothetical protein QBC39DRAFT_379961 [Podospora conica]|nr:hypothetical protein QBC39DRAFT_379961 [Schizothecium conicum]
MVSLLPGPDDNISAALRIPCIVFFIVTPSVVALRIWARVRVGSWRGLGLDDCAIVVSMICTLISMGYGMAALHHGMGRGYLYLGMEKIMAVLKMFWLLQVFQKLSINISKLSILLLYLRIFIQKWFRITCHILLVVVLSFTVASVVSGIFQCTPVARAWDRRIPGTCLWLPAIWMSGTVFLIVSNFVILGLPMYPIYQSHLLAGQKVAIMAVLSLGLVTAVTGFMRIPTYYDSNVHKDPTYATIPSAFWLILDQNLAIICACLPVCRLPLSCLFPRKFSGSTLAGRKKFTGTNNSTALATNSYRPSDYHEIRPGYKISPGRTLYPHPLEMGVLEATPGWVPDDDIDSCKMGQYVYPRSVAHITSHAEAVAARAELGPGIHLVREYAVTYERVGGGV